MKKAVVEKVFAARTRRPALLRTPVFDFGAAMFQPPLEPYAAKFDKFVKFVRFNGVKKLESKTNSTPAINP
jgi:hypothetical protein